jgi:hypothetical protein
VNWHAVGLQNIDEKKADYRLVFVKDVINADQIMPFLEYKYLDERLLTAIHHLFSWCLVYIKRETQYHTTEKRGR